MNQRQANALRRILEASHPDLITTVTPEPDGAEITMRGPRASSGSSHLGEVKLGVSNDSPYVRAVLARAVSRLNE